MAETHVVFALIERRARLAGELREKQVEVRCGVRHLHNSVSDRYDGVVAPMHQGF